MACWEEYAEEEEEGAGAADDEEVVEDDAVVVEPTVDWRIPYLDGLAEFGLSTPGFDEEEDEEEEDKELEAAPVTPAEGPADDDDGRITRA